MDRSLITNNIRRPNRLGHLFTRRRWNKIRDAVKSRIYMNKEKLLNSNTIYEAKVHDIDNVDYVPNENIQYTNELSPITHATELNTSRNIDNYGYDDNINLGEPVKLGTVEGNVKDNILTRIMRTRRLPPIESIPTVRSHERRITQKNAGSKLNKNTKRKNKHTKKIYKNKI